MVRKGNANKFSIFSLKIVITTFIFIFLLSILVFSLINPSFLGYTHYSEIILDSFTVLIGILFPICTYRIYKFLNSDSPWYFNIIALYYSIHITIFYIYNAFFTIKGYPLILSLASSHYPNAGDSFHNTFHDMGYCSITDDMGIILFNHYLYQHLDNEPMFFLPQLVCLDEEKVIGTFANDHNMLKDCILEYNAQKRDAILDSYNTLESIVNNVVERARSELNINLLERHSIKE